jgi:hypothetical protein
MCSRSPYSAGFSWWGWREKSALPGNSAPDFDCAVMSLPKEERWNVRRRKTDSQIRRKVSGVQWSAEFIPRSIS